MPRYNNNNKKMRLRIQKALEANNAKCTMMMVDDSAFISKDMPTVVTCDHTSSSKTYRESITTTTTSRTTTTRTTATIPSSSLDDDDDDCSVISDVTFENINEVSPWDDNDDKMHNSGLTNDSGLLTNSDDISC